MKVWEKAVFSDEPIVDAHYVETRQADMAMRDHAEGVAVKRDMT